MKLRRTPLLVTTGAVATALVAAGIADVTLEHIAREHIVHAAVCKLAPAGKVSADLTGTLAGLRLLTGDVGTIRIHADDVRRDGARLDVSAELHGVTTKGATSGGTATATIPYRELDRRLGGAGAAGLSVGGDASGLVLTGTLAGLPLPVTVHTGLTTGKNTLTVTPTAVSLFGSDIPVAQLSARPLTSGLADRLAPRTVRLPTLPDGAELTGARAGADGLQLLIGLPHRSGSSAPDPCTPDRG